MMMEVKYCMSISDGFFQYIIPLGIFFRNIWWLFEVKNTVSKTKQSFKTQKSWAVLIYVVKLFDVGDPLESANLSGLWLSGFQASLLKKLPEV